MALRLQRGRILSHYAYRSSTFKAAADAAVGAQLTQAAAAADGAARSGVEADIAMMEAYAEHFGRLRSAAAAAFAKLRDG